MDFDTPPQCTDLPAATPPAKEECQGEEPTKGPPSTPYGDDAVNARQNNVTNHGERLKALLSKLSNLKIVNKESKAVREPSNASLPESPKLERTQPTDKDSERGDLSDTQHSTGSASATTPPSEYGYADDAGRGTAILSSVMFMPAISMDDIEGWEPVGENQ